MRYEATWLDDKAYISDFYAEYEALSSGLWKLEVGQVFSEPDNESWILAHNGNWRESMDCAQIDAEKANSKPWPRYPSRRLRIFTRPLSSYLTWEMNYLAKRNVIRRYCRLLEDVDVPSDLAHLLSMELVILDERVMYEVKYKPNGELNGAFKSVQFDLIAALLRDVRVLYEKALSFDEFEQKFLRCDNDFPALG